MKSIALTLAVLVATGFAAFAADTAPSATDQDKMSMTVEEGQPGQPENVTATIEEEGKASTN